MSKIIIEAERSEKHYWADLWRFRSLLGFIAWRDILVRYKQTVVGAAWAVIRPLLTVLVGAGVFGGLAGMPSDGVPYIIMVCCGTLPWYLYSNAMVEAANSLVGNPNLITKVYFPRMILAGGAVVVTVVDFLVSLAILAALLAWYHVLPTWRLSLLPLITLLILVSAMGPGLLFAALNVKFRDFRYILPFLMQLGLFVSPVFYSTSAVHSKFGQTGVLLAAINPIAGLINAFRWAIIGKGPIDWPSFVISNSLGLALLALGVWYFRRTERTFADVI